MELSCVAGLNLMLAVRASCERQVFRGDRMGATWTHVRLGLELWPAWYFDTFTGSLPSPSFPSFLSSVSWLLLAACAKLWFASAASDGEEEGPPSLQSDFTLFSPVLIWEDLRGTGEGVGESVPVQLSLRFWKINRRVIFRIWTGGFCKICGAGGVEKCLCVLAARSQECMSSP